MAQLKKLEDFEFTPNGNKFYFIFNDGSRSKNYSSKNKMAGLAYIEHLFFTGKIDANKLYDLHNEICEGKMMRDFTRLLRLVGNERSNPTYNTESVEYPIQGKTSSARKLPLFVA